MKRLTTLLMLFLTMLLTEGFAMAQKECCADDTRAYLGIYSEKISGKKAELLGFDNPYGNYVTGVVAGTPAQRAGLQAFDYIHGIGEEMTSFTRSMTDLLADHKAGESSVLHIVRKGEKMQLPIVFGSRANQQTLVAGKEKAFLGVGLHAQNAAYNDRIGVKIYVVRNATAMEMGLEDGDVITHINGHTIVDWRDISIATNSIEVGEEVTIDFLRGDQTMQAAGTIKSQGEAKRQQRVIASDWKPKNYAHLGIYSNSVSSQKAKKLNFDNPYGSYVTRVIDNTAAAAAGLQPFDYVYGVDEYRTQKDLNLTGILKKYTPGDEVTLHFIRNGTAQNARVTLGSRQISGISFDTEPCETPLLGVREFGKNSGKGVMVQIVRRSTAAIMAMESGDVIVRINGNPIIDWSDISTAIDNMQVGETVQVEFLRKGKIMTVSSPIKSYCDAYPEEGMNLNFNIDLPNISVEIDEEENAPGIADEPIRDVDVNRAMIELRDLSEAETEEMRARFGIDLSTKNDLQIDNLNLFPDPQTGRYELQFSLPQEGETKISIYNAAGRQIYEYDLGVFRGDFRDQVDISQNGIGNYYLEIRHNNKLLSKKILLQTR